MTLSDVRVFPSLVRFDEVYNVYFKCNKKRIVDYPNILNYCRDLYQSYPDGFASTTHMDHIKVRFLFLFLFLCGFCCGCSFFCRFSLDANKQKSVQQLVVKEIIASCGSCMCGVLF